MFQQLFLLKRLSFLHLIDFAALSKISWLSLCGPASELYSLACFITLNITAEALQCICLTWTAPLESRRIYSLPSCTSTWMPNRHLRLATSTCNMISFPTIQSVPPPISMATPSSLLLPSKIWTSLIKWVKKFCCFYFKMHHESNHFSSSTLLPCWCKPPSSLAWSLQQPPNWSPRFSPCFPVVYYPQSSCRDPGKVRSCHSFPQAPPVSFVWIQSKF